MVTVSSSTINRTPGVNPTATAWVTVNHPSGHYIKSVQGNVLARWVASGLFFYEKGLRQEVFISFDSLIHLAS